MSGQKMNEPHANRDPITGEKGAHPVGTGLGAAVAGAATGAAGGAVGGPVGAVIGAVVGGVAGGLAGHAAAEAIDPTTEDAYWRENYNSRPYASQEVPYETYSPAYKYGWESQGRHAGRSFDETEGELRAGWEKTSHNARLSWDKAKPATRDAWRRVESAAPQQKRPL
jgi:hypothetical protein